jgi:TonB family protein
MLHRALGIALAATLIGSPVLADQADNVMNLTNWRVPRAGASFVANEHGLRVSGGRGWAHATTPVMDFVVRLEFRAITPDAEAAVVVRGGVTRPNQLPEHGYAVWIGEAANPNAKLGEVRGYRHRKRVRTVSGAAGPLRAAAPGAWHLLLVTCEEDVVTVSVDGATLTSVRGEEPLAGYVGLEHVRGELEIRDVRLVPHAVGRPCGSHEAPAQPPSGLVLPKLVKEVRPLYPLYAQLARLQGVVGLEVVIGTDGVPQMACVQRSVDPELDAYAVAAARRWRFTPLMRDNQAVAVRVTVEMAFRLK